MPDFKMDDGTQPQEIDLGNSNLRMHNEGTGTAKVYVDRKSTVNPKTYTSAILGSAGYANPITLGANKEKLVRRTDLESEAVRLAVEGAGAQVKFSY